MTTRALKFVTLKGYENRTNVVLNTFTQDNSQSTSGKCSQIHVHFVGDCQRKEDSEFYNGKYSRLKNYCVENVAQNLSRRFPNREILLIEPKEFINSRSIYTNFVRMTTESMSIPHYSFTPDCYLHLQELILDFLRQSNKQELLEKNERIVVSLSGFSSGGIVLNQMIYSLKTIEQSEMKINLSSWYFLDIGSCLMHGNYIFTKNILEPIKSSNDREDCDVEISIGLTDFQTSYKQNPSYVREAELFKQTLNSLDGVKIIKDIHLNANNHDYLALHFSIYDQLFFGRI